MDRSLRGAGGWCGGWAAGGAQGVGGCVFDSAVDRIGTQTGDRAEWLCYSWLAGWPSFLSLAIDYDGTDYTFPDAFRINPVK